jgi:hypothetical protein
MLASKLVSAIKKVYPSYGLRNNDIIFASYPKSGNTWVRFIWYNLISIKEYDGIEINFHNIDGKFAAVYDNHNFGQKSYDCIPRLVKTHKTYDQVFNKFKTIYLYRNPKDVMVSYYSYLNARTEKNEISSDISQFIRSKEYGLPAWYNHYISWIDKCDISITYKELKISEKIALQKILKEFEIDNISNKELSKSIERSKFDKMRRIEEDKGRPQANDKVFNSDHKFTRKGEVGSGTKELNKNDIEYIDDFLIKKNISI